MSYKFSPYIDVMTIFFRLKLLSIQIFNPHDFLNVKILLLYHRCIKVLLEAASAGVIIRTVGVRCLFLLSGSSQLLISLICQGACDHYQHHSCHAECPNHHHVGFSVFLLSITILQNR